MLRLVADLKLLQIGGSSITHLLLAVFEAKMTVTGNLSLLKAQGNLYTALISISLHIKQPVSLYFRNEVSQDEVETKSCNDL